MCRCLKRIVFNKRENLLKVTVDDPTKVKHTHVLLKDVSGLGLRTGTLRCTLDVLETRRGYGSETPPSGAPTNLPFSRPFLVSLNPSPKGVPLRSRQVSAGRGTHRRTVLTRSSGDYGTHRKKGEHLGRTRLRSTPVEVGVHATTRTPEEIPIRLLVRRRTPLTRPSRDKTLNRSIRWRIHTLKPHRLFVGTRRRRSRPVTDTTDTRITGRVESVGNRRVCSPTTRDDG